MVAWSGEKEYNGFNGNSEEKVNFHEA